MFKNIASILSAGAILALAGCSGTATTLTGGGAVPLTVIAQSTPSKTTSIRSFRLQVSSAILNPGNVQLLAAPVSIDLAQITSGSAFLSSVKASAGTYSSMTVTFSSPSVTIFNPTAAAMAIPGGSCASQSTCTFVPNIKNAEHTITTGAFPLTVTEGTQASFAVTMAEGKILQPDDSVDFVDGVDSGIDQSGDNTNGQDTSLGVVQSFSSGQMVLVSESNAVSPSLITDANTVYNFPPSVCSANNASCVSQGEIVATTLSVTSAGVLHADSVSYADAANASLVEGTITSVAPGGNTFQMQVDQSFGLPTNSNVDTLTVTVQKGALFGVGSVGFPIVSGASFLGVQGLLAGQSVLVDVGRGSTLPNVITSQILLTDSDSSGTLSALTSNSFLLTTYSQEQDNASPTTSQVIVQTGINTQYRNLLPASFSTLTNGQSVSAQGPLFNAPSGPILAATQLSLHSSTDQ